MVYIDLRWVYIAVLVNYIALCIFTVILYRFWKLKGHLIGWAKAYATTQGQRSGEARREIRDAKLVQSGQQKLMDNIASTIPGAATILKSSGLSEQEGWAMITDPATMKGIKVIVDALGGVAKFIDKTDKPRKKRKGIGQAPLIELKHE